MKSSIFPDVNVWVALSYQSHLHHATANQWFESLSPSTSLIFCRHTQLGLFRLLSTEAVLKSDVLTQRGCWDLFDRWTISGPAKLVAEPAGLEAAMRARTGTEFASPKIWADAYLAAFAETANLILVTFDRALAGKTKKSILLN
jgi:toxin-antitoxin system PIN domain toxin